MFLRIPKFYVCWLTLAFIRNYTCLSYVSYQNKERQSVSTRTTLNSSQLIDRSITNGAKLINLPPESPLSGWSDKFVRDPFKIKEPVYNAYD